MRRRCDDPQNPRYERYGGRGIHYCESWKVYENFLADMGERPPNHQIERINNDAHYEPQNCCWIEKKLQARNKSTNFFITHEGTTLTLVEWSEKVGIPPRVIQQRLRKHNWPVDRALTAPIRKVSNQPATYS